MPLENIKRGWEFLFRYFNEFLFNDLANLFCGAITLHICCCNFLHHMLHLFIYCIKVIIEFPEQNFGPGFPVLNLNDNLFFVFIANTHYRIINSPIHNGVRSTLIIKQAIASDFGPYTCAIENNHGVSELRIELEQRSKSTFHLKCL